MTGETFSSVTGHKVVFRGVGVVGLMNYVAKRACGYICLVAHGTTLGKLIHKSRDVRVALHLLKANVETIVGATCVGVTVDTPVWMLIFYGNSGKCYVAVCPGKCKSTCKDKSRRDHRY